MPVTCPSCDSTLDPRSFNPIAQTGHCATCGEVHPRVVLSGEPVEGWSFTWRRDGKGLSFSENPTTLSVHVRVGLAVTCVLFLSAITILPDAELGSIKPLIIMLCAIALPAAAFRRWPRRGLLTREEFSWSRFGGRLAHTKDVMGFRVVSPSAPRQGLMKSDDSEVDQWTLAALIAGRDPVVLCASSSPAALRAACARLNEALFLVMATTLRSGPYR
jgi:hypothetical protein